MGIFWERPFVWLLVAWPGELLELDDKRLVALTGHWSHDPSSLGRATARSGKALFADR